MGLHGIHIILLEVRERRYPILSYRHNIHIHQQKQIPKDPMTDS